LNDGEWHHVVATRDSGTGEIKIYVDGSTTPEAAGTGNTNSLTASTKLAIGSLQGGVNYFTGILDDLRVYNIVLTPADIAILYDQGGTQPPVLTAPSSGGSGTADIDFTLPEPATDGTVKITFTENGTSLDANDPHVITFNSNFKSSGQHTTLLDGDNLSFNINVTSVSNEPNDLLAVNAIYDVKLEYQDALGNAVASVTNTGYTFTGDETVAPTIDSGVLALDNSYVDVTFSEGVYGAAAGILQVSDFALIFAQNAGSATGANITNVTQNDGVTALTGGETIIRVHLSITGSPDGLETVEIKPAGGASIYDAAGNAALATETTGALTLAVGGWYNGSWAHRIKITIDSAKVSGAGSLTNYPMLISIASNADIASSGRTDGFDILFTSDDGTSKLDHEIEKYDNATGELVVWVRIPSLSATVDTDIYIYYGNPSAADQSNAAGVWDTGFQGVWHLKETDIDGGAGDIKDSSSNLNNITTFGMDNTNQIPGKIAGSFDLDGIDDLFSVDNSVDKFETQPLSVSFWMNVGHLPSTPSVGRDVYLGGKMNSSTPHSWLFFIDDGSANALEDHLYFRTWNTIDTQKSTYTGAVIAIGSWYYVTGTIDAGGNMLLYVDGVQQAPTPTLPGSMADSDKPLDMGEILGWELDGNIDELRISSSVRSADWVITDYNTQFDPAGTITVGSEVNNPDPFIDSGTLASDNSYVDVTFSEGVYNSAAGSGALDAADFIRVFDGTGGTATDVTIFSVKQNDSATEATASALVGGETVVRVFLTLVGTPNGVETVEIKPVDGASIYDVDGNAVLVTYTTGPLT
ncbi:hypothetical protein LCGC14_1907780, partial [marine sediment metagenome]